MVDSSWLTQVPLGTDYPKKCTLRKTSESSPKFKRRYLRHCSYDSDEIPHIDTELDALSNVAIFGRFGCIASEKNWVKIQKNHCANRSALHTFGVHFSTSSMSNCSILAKPTGNKIPNSPSSLDWSCLRNNWHRSRPKKKPKKFSFFKFSQKLVARCLWKFLRNRRIMSSVKSIHQFSESGLGCTSYGGGGK